jgi:putative salt-induced outer membrane protein YdiY
MAEVMRESPRVLAALPLVVLAGALVQAGSAQAADPIVEPCTGSSDWLQLTSSEWLRGELRRMRTDAIEFESDKLKSQSLEWKDVASLCVAGIARFVRSDRTFVQGTGHVRDGTVVVLTATGEQSFPRDDLLAILPGEARERQRWSLSAGLGANFATGNTNQSALNFSLAVRREDRVTRGEVEFQGNYGRADGVDTANQQRVNADLDYFLSRRFYLTLAELALVRDPFQNTALRAVPSAGAGYRIIDASRFEWEVGLGMGYQYLEFISTTTGRPPSQNDVANRLSTSFSWTIVSDLDLDVEHYSVFVWTSLGQSTEHTQATLSYELTKLLDIDITAIHDYTWEPVANDQGEVPDKNDFRLTVGLSVEFR